jgi:hypothetical protein
MAEANPKVVPKKAADKPVKATSAVTEAKKTKKIPSAPAAVVAQPPAVKKPAARKSGEDKVVAEKRAITAEYRYRMIAEAAYYRAESCRFESDPVRDWIEAERDIAILLGEDK